MIEHHRLLHWTVLWYQTGCCKASTQIPDSSSYMSVWRWLFSPWCHHPWYHCYSVLCHVFDTVLPWQLVTIQHCCTKLLFADIAVKRNTHRFTLLGILVRSENKIRIICMFLTNVTIACRSLTEVLRSMQSSAQSKAPYQCSALLRPRPLFLRSPIKSSRYEYDDK